MYGNDNDDGATVRTNSSKNSTNIEKDTKVLTQRNDSAEEGSGYGERGASNDDRAGGKALMRGAETSQWPGQETLKSKRQLEGVTLTSHMRARGEYRKVYTLFCVYFVVYTFLCIQ